MLKVSCWCLCSSGFCVIAPRRICLNNDAVITFMGYNQGSSCVLSDTILFFKIFISVYDLFLKFTQSGENAI